MITPFNKYSFLIFHQDYTAFLKELQNLGVVHIIRKNPESPENLKRQLEKINQIKQAIQFLQSRKIPQDKTIPSPDPESVLSTIQHAQIEKERLVQQLNTLRKEIANLEPWGAFSLDMIAKLKQVGIKVRFFSTSEKKFDPEWLNRYTLEVISQSAGTVYFVVFTADNEEIALDAEENKQPEHAISDSMKLKIEVENKLEELEKEFDRLASVAIPELENLCNRLEEHLDYELAKSSSEAQADDKLMVLEGWVPTSQDAPLQEFLDREKIVFLIQRPVPGEQVPILLKNSRYSHLFEPIGKLFSLPAYVEIDLTAFFAPFFTLFFGFCLGDAGYGLLILIACTLAKSKVNPEYKSYLSLGQVLGAATLFVGILTGTMFGVSLIEQSFISPSYRAIILTQDKIFMLSLILGVIQILFGMGIQVANRIIQYGFRYAISTMGWIVIILSIPLFIFFPDYGIINKSVLGLGGLMAATVILWDPAPIMPNKIANGVYVIYSAATGFFGDVLSYIRLFALGVSGGILGLVVNSMAVQFGQLVPFIGPVIFILILVIGHVGNLLLCSLGAFVHPMRLTFVEFYKNAGFAGGGKPYQPFAYKK
ncbi:MAG: V-type ATP synthase subunit I [Candidatus Delongbacteria bacterium]|nr:V-type ATP synthase subunit I [Candidatus Delongbacteria bacterium]